MQGSLPPLLYKFFWYGTYRDNFICACSLTLVYCVADNMKPKKPIDLTTLKGKEQEVFDDEVAAEDEEEEDDDEEEDNDTEDTVDEEEEDDDDYVEEDTSSSTAGTLPTPSPTPAPARHLQPASSAPVTQVPTPDPYFTHFDPRLEHQAYKDAQQRLEEMHREKVTKVSTHNT